MAPNDSGWDAGTADPALIQSMIQNESAGNPRAVSPKGARGLMQIMPQTAAQFGVKPDQLFQPKENQWLGTHYYNQLLDHYQGNPFLALVAYHSGPGRVDKGILLPESVKFASKELTGAGGAQSVWQKIKGSMAGGTAYAQEPPGQQAAAPQLAAPAPAAAGAIPIDQFFQQMGQQQAQSPQAVSPQMQSAGGTSLGTRETLRLGPFSKTIGPTETTGTATTEEKLSDQRQRLIQLGEEMQELYNKRLKGKLSAGAISSVGQGLDYTETGPMRYIGHNIDPDVEDWIVKSGQFAQALNSYYAASGGGRGGVGYYGEVTSPHAPHPPQGLREVLGVVSPTGQQWDLQKQGEQLPTLLHNLRRDQGLEGQQHYQQWTPGQQELPSGFQLEK